MAVRDLGELLRTLSVRQRPGRWVIMTGIVVPPDVPVAATVVEDEGTTSVVAFEDAERLGADLSFVAAWLTLDMFSSLDAIGLTAAVARALAERGIPCNVLAGFHHDHLLVPYELAGPAMAAIDGLRTPATRSSGAPPSA